MPPHLHRTAFGAVQVSATSETRVSDATILHNHDPSSIHQVFEPRFECLFYERKPFEPRFEPRTVRASSFFPLPHSLFTWACHALILCSLNTEYRKLNTDDHSPLQLPNHLTTQLTNY